MVEPTPFTHVSGYSNRFNEMLKYLQKAGDEVEVITPDNLEEAPKEAHGFKINNIKGFKFPLYPLITLAVDARLKTLSLLTRFKPDIMHVSSPSFLVAAAIFNSWWMGVPLVMSYHTHLPIYARNYGEGWWWMRAIGPDRCESWAWKLIRMVHSNADLTLVTSPQMQEEMLERGVERVDVWRKGIDTVRFHPHFKSTETRNVLSGGNPKQPLLLYVGRLGVEKCLRDLKGVLDANPAYRLALVGKGPDEEELKDFFKDNHVVFTGQLSGDALSEAFASADVFVMPSDSETLGFVVLEAMASGVPVVGARAGGIPSLLDDGKTGFLANPRDGADFAAKVRMAVGDSEKRDAMAKAAREEAERWDWESATAHLRNVNYEKAVRNYKVRTGKAATLFKYCRNRTSEACQWFTGQFSAEFTGDSAELA